jgi:lysozyme
LVNTIEDQLIRDEGLRLKPYKDTVGKLTIGVGRNLDAEGISEEEARILLRNDIVKAGLAVAKALPWVQYLDDIRFAVLLNMSFNMGIGGLLEFKKTLAHVRAKQYAEAAKDMLQSHWAQQVGVRAQRLARQMETGQWQ